MAKWISSSYACRAWTKGDLRDKAAAMTHSAAMEKSIKKALLSAVRARKLAYAPYSGFQVGAAVITTARARGTKSGARAAQIYSGSNVENASYGGTVCAERVAIFKAVADGLTEFSDIVVVTDATQPAFPCGFCRQVMAEFFAPETTVWIANLDGIQSKHTFAELLPKPFGPKQLKKAKKS